MSAPDPSTFEDGLTPAWKDNVLPFVQGELSGKDLQAFEHHLKTDDLCRVAVYEARKTIDRLKQVPNEIAPDELTTRILKAVKDENHRSKLISFPSSSRNTVFKIAACLALLIGGLTLYNRMSPETLNSSSIGQTEAAVEKGLVWLLQTQGETGAWDGQQWAGNDRYTIGITALSLLALTGNDHEEFKQQHKINIQRSARFLLSTQNREGRFGGDFKGTRFDHAIATRALLEVYEFHPTKELRDALDQALYSISREINQTPSVYEKNIASRDQNFWALTALQRAFTLGWEHLPPRSQNLDIQTSQNIESLVQHSQTDINFYNLYLSSAQLALQSPYDRETLSGELTQLLLSAQETKNQHAGSWPLSEHINATGGRVYSTAMATLTLSQLSNFPES